MEIIGKVFKGLTVIKILPLHKSHIMCECLCVCGKSCICRRSALLSGSRTSCGCLRGKDRIKDIAGQRFGNLTVLHRALTQKREFVLWVCQCACGNKTTARGTALRYGQVRSCGCLSGIPNTPDYPYAALKWIIRMYVGGAKSRNLDFKLSDGEFLNVIQNPCHYCGDKGRDWGAAWYQEKIRRVSTGITKRFDEKAKDFSLVGNGIDRLDNSICYTVKNCVPCCATCNMMKKALSEQEFLNHIKRVSNYRKL